MFHLLSNVTDRLLLDVLPLATIVALHLDHRRHADLVNLGKAMFSTENQVKSYLVEVAE